ncbi:MAG: tetratricopeptide repeat protein [Duncaniella sp.]|nr:tetratricopeptide repeat protein [Duncaniella sp.]
MRLRLWTILITVLGVVAAALTSCSPKKNTAASRRYQEFITRYNIYYNGDEHYKETLKEMEKNYEDDYSRTLFVHPAEARGDEKAPQPSGSFKRSIEKAQKAIQLRSIKKRPARKAGKGNDPAYKEWLKRDEYNPFLHNAWLMMGRSQFLDGDFLGAASTFYYITKHFKWLPATVTEAQLWQARSYCALDWLFEAETILTRVKPDDLTSSKLKNLYNITFADYYIRSRAPEKAIPYLKEAVRYASGSQKTRLYFLLGQLYEETGQPGEAYKAFDKAGSSSAAGYRTKFNARIKQSEVYQGDDITPEVKALRRMTRYDRNKEYLDQIYYAIGNLYLSRGDTTQAISNYELAAAKSTRNGIDKAMAQVKLGNLYYDRGRYDLAQPCLSEAVPLLPETFPDYKTLRRRSDVLDELAIYSQNVELNDSLLRLSAMSPDEQLKVVNRIIDELKKKEKEMEDEARREEYMAQQAANGNTLQGNNAPSSFTLNTDKSWYFYNTATRNAGRTEFQKRWGSRKLEDNWRRRDKSSFSLDEFPDDEDGESGADEEPDERNDDEKAEAARRESDPHFPEYYLKQIPATDADRAVANDVIQEGLYNMGIILKDKLEDFDAATGEFGKLMGRYPDNIYRLEVYYNLYLMNMRRGNTAEAEKYRRLLIDEFPESKYAVALADPNYFDNIRRMDIVQAQLYDQAYADYLADNNGAVHRAYERMSEDFPLSPLMPKFMFLHALAYVTERRHDDFSATITSLLERYPDTDLTPVAGAWLKGLRSGRELRTTSGNRRSMLWDIRLSNDSTALSAEAGDLEFKLAPDSPQLLVLLFPTDSISPNTLLYEVARHNFNTFMVRDFDLELMNFGRLGLLVIKGFENERELNYYRSLFEGPSGMDLPADVRPVPISQENFDLLLSGAGSFDDYFNFIGEETVRNTHESVLPPDEYPSAEEMYPEIEAAYPSADEIETEDMLIDMPEAEEEPAIVPVPEPEAKEVPVTVPEPETKEEPVTATEPPATPAAPAVSTPVPTTPVPTTPELPGYLIGSEGDEDD